MFTFISPHIVAMYTHGNVANKAANTKSTESLILAQNDGCMVAEIYNFVL